MTLELARRAESDRPDLFPAGRPGERLTEITSLVRADGATAEAIPCDLSRLARRSRCGLRSPGPPRDGGGAAAQGTDRERGCFDGSFFRWRPTSRCAWAGTADQRAGWMSSMRDP